MRRNENVGERLWKAESLVDLLGKMDPDKLPPAEGRAVRECQAKAVQDWLAAYIDMRSAPSSLRPD